MKLKVFSSFLLSFAIVATSVSWTFAEGEEDAKQAALNNISQNCASIKLQLQRTQKEDSRMRVHLGAQYETISTNLMQNLNIRLVRNNMSDPNLAEQQIAFASERDRFKDEFIAALSNDINTSMAITVLYDVVKADIDCATKLALICDFDKVLGFDLAVEKETAGTAGVDPELEKYITEQIELRKAAKKEKNFAEADRIRAELLEKGVVLEDTREGVKWHLA